MRYEPEQVVYFQTAMSLKLQNAAQRITVVERNKTFDTFGWGVVLSDQTLGNLQAADPVTAQLSGEALNHWDHIEVFFKGRSVRSGGAHWVIPLPWAGWDGENSTAADHRIEKKAEGRHLNEDVPSSRAQTQAGMQTGMQAGSS